MLPSPAIVEHAANLAAERAAWHERRLGLAAQDGLDGRAMRRAIMAALDRRLADDAVLVADTGYSSAWAGALSEIKEAGRHFMRADGSLGWASRRRWAPSSRSPIGRSCASPVTAASANTSVTSRRPSATSCP